MLIFIMHFNSNYCSLKTFGRKKKKKIKFGILGIKRKT
jgi:hypothetical protein